MASITEEFFSHFPELLLRQAVAALRCCYTSAPEVGATVGLDEDFNRWNLPLLRRVTFEQRLLDLATAFGSPIAARKAFASDRNTPYTVIQSGPFFLTVSHVHGHGALPPKCGFRMGNSSHNYSLFADTSDCSDPTRYAILAHGSRNGGRELRWFEVIFPDADYERVAASIDLLHRYPVEGVSTSTASTTRPTVETPVEKIEDQSQPVLKKKPGQKRKAE